MHTPAEKLEHSFLGIAHAFFMLLTGVTLVAAIVAGIWGGIQLRQKASTDIAAASPTYQQFLEKKAREKAEAARVEKKGAANAPSVSGQPRPSAVPRDTIPAEFLPVLNDIEASLTRFSQIVNEHVPENIRKQIYDKAVRLQGVMPVSRILADCQTQSAALASDAPRMASLDPGDADYVTWQEFLTFFFDSSSFQVFAGWRRWRATGR